MFWLLSSPFSPEISRSGLNCYLGRRYSFKYGAFDAIVELPDADKSFGLFDHSAYHGFLLPSKGMNLNSVKSISALRISLSESVELVSDKFELVRQVSDFFKSGQPVAHAIIAKLVFLIKVGHGQTWIGLSGQRFEMVGISDRIATGGGRIYDDESGVPFPLCIVMGHQVCPWPLPGREEPVSLLDFELLIEKMREDVEVPTPEVLLVSGLTCITLFLQTHSSNLRFCWQPSHARRRSNLSCGSAFLAKSPPLSNF